MKLKSNIPGIFRVSQTTWTAECEAGTWINSLPPKRVDCSFQKKVKSLPLAKEIKYHDFLFMLLSAIQGLVNNQKGQGTVGPTTRLPHGVIQLTLCDRVRSSDIWSDLKIEPLVL